MKTERQTEDKKNKSRLDLLNHLEYIKRRKKMSKKNKVIKPELLGGFRDFLPEIMIPRQAVINKITETMEKFGFLPLDTPSLERSSVLGTDEDEFKMEVYRFKDSLGEKGQDVTLRFDLTVPLSRVVAANPEILKPFKRYQYGKVFRKEKPQSGRYREFAQFDADIVGSDSVMADIEIIQLMYQVMKNLEVGEFVIRFNNRKILNGLAKKANFGSGKSENVFRVLDKLEKIGLGEVVKELQRKPDNEYDDTALALSDRSMSKIKEFLSLSSKISELKKFFRGITIAEEGIKECEEIIEALTKLKIPKENWQFDLSIARGLGYYTGPVFETTLSEIPEIGSVFSGGRFDELIMRFTGEKVPATGASVGLDRLIAALEKLGKLPKKKYTAKVIIARIDRKLDDDLLTFADELRQAGIPTEIFLGGPEISLKEQIIYTAKREIPYMVIFGEEEARAGKFKLKNMQKRKEELLTKEELITRLS